MAKVVSLFEQWSRNHGPAEMTVEVVKLEDELGVASGIPGNSDNTVLLYGHLDKQPEMTGWSEGLGPWTPVLKDDRLYGRGGADDGYALFASLSAINILREQKLAHTRCVVLIEACEESGSYDLRTTSTSSRRGIGKPDLVVCLDSGCGNYDQLWCTTSLRGMMTATLTASVLTEGVHSGDASGIIPSSFRVIRSLLNRVENPATGEVLLDAFHVEIPPDRVEQAENVGRVLQSEVYDKFPLTPGMQPVTQDPAELILNRTWRPTLSITGANGLPAIGNAGNVLRPRTELKLSLRLPPTANSQAAIEQLSKILSTNPPYGAQVTLDHVEGCDGWAAPPVAPWLHDSLQRASDTYFGSEVVYMGEGGSIPFMAMLGEKFPEAQFLITGVLGPHSQRTWPKRVFSILPCAQRITCCVAQVLADHMAQR